MRKLAKLQKEILSKSKGHEATLAEENARLQRELANLSEALSAERANKVRE